MRRASSGFSVLAVFALLLLVARAAWADVAFRAPVLVTTFEPQVYLLQAADLNGDGRPDLIVSREAINSISVLLGRGDGTFDTPVTYPVGARPESQPMVADLNGD